MVRAERKGVLYDTFQEMNLVAIGWSVAGDFTQNPESHAILAALHKAYPDASEQTNRVAAGQIARFISEIEIGDHVITYDSNRRVYAVGLIKGPAVFDETKVSLGGETYAYIRFVEWLGEVDRDALSQSARYSLGSLLTFFQIKPFVEEEIFAALEGRKEPSRAEDEEVQNIETVSEGDIAERSIELISDMVARLGPDEMEHFVAGLLRAMGYHTKVSAPGPDRGEDIRATPDPLGLEDPRIVVEVKHRKGAIGAPQLRSFLGGRHPADKGLYVSTGGFSKDARYEAARASIPLQLLTLEDLVELVIEHYEKMDIEARAMVPLKQIYWPLA
ncbi:restriction endonuclease [Rhodobacteraceae bacterium GS-10]|uniref:Restriction endonuclease n=2 Tax=Thalassovita mangrovi TaxID=2692236 RepID=A0A6L8LHW5_9RHOB|nr:restriction endonuclease [Thalassovita mangrovi]